MQHRQTTLKNTKTLALALFLRAEGADGPGARSETL